MASKKYFYDDNYFEKIDSEDKAYYLGFLYADGYVNNVGYNNYVELTLQKEDEYILEKFLILLKSNRKVINIRNNKYSRVIINSKKIMNDLINLGCVNKKTHILKFPTNIEYKYIPHIIRGFFDGDGCICHIKNHNDYHISFTGNVDFLCGIEKYFLENLDIDKKKHYSICNGNRKNNIRRLKYGGNHIITEIFNLLYKDSTIYLSRKYNKFLDAKKNIKEKNHIVFYDGIKYDSYNKTKLINIIQNKTNIKRYTISSKLRKGYSVEELLKNKLENNNK
jgi:LAGLIDADG-like domain